MFSSGEQSGLVGDIGGGLVLNGEQSGLVLSGDVSG